MTGSLAQTRSPTGSGPAGSVVERLGVRLERVDGDGGLDPCLLLRLALRDNPRRAQLLVSTVLGKHVPADPRLVRGAARLLGLLVADVLATPADPDLHTDPWLDGERPVRPQAVDPQAASRRPDGERPAASRSRADPSPAGPSPDAGRAAVSLAADRSGVDPSPAGVQLGVGRLSTARPTVDPSFAELLAAAIADRPGAATALPTTVAPTDALVLGFAETATALGHGVAETLHTDYLHSTRRRVPGHAPAGAFVEAHSHAVDHLLLPADRALLAGPRPLVLVDDELSTGRTVVNTIRALHAIAPRERYVVAALVDARPTTPDGLPDAHPAARPSSGLRDARPATLAFDGLPDGIRVDVVSLARARVHLPADLGARAETLRATLAHVRPPADPAAPAGSLRGRASPTRVPPTAEPVACAEARGPKAAPAPAGATLAVHLSDVGWPANVPVGGRHGFTAAHHDAWDALAPAVARGLAGACGLRPGERLLVLGTEELMALPLRLAAALADAGHAVAFSSTTRSPAVVVDEPDYALTSGITFPAPDDAGPRFAYNVARGFDHVLVVVDPPADTPVLRSGLLAALAPHTGRTTVVVTP